MTKPGGREKSADRIRALCTGKCEKAGKESSDIRFSGIYTLLFQEQERQVQGEEENQQEENGEEMQGNVQDDTGNEKLAIKRNY